MNNTVYWRISSIVENKSESKLCPAISVQFLPWTWILLYLHFFQGLRTNLLVALPQCILMKLHHYTTHHSLRSNDFNFPVTPKTTAVTYGDRSFAVITPKLWNQVPLATLFSLKMVNFTNQNVTNYKRLIIDLFTCKLTGTWKTLPWFIFIVYNSKATLRWGYTWLFWCQATPNPSAYFINHCLAVLSNFWVIFLQL